MEQESQLSRPDHAFDALENRLDELIALCDRLSEENASLRAEQAAMAAERDELLEKNELSRARIEAMVARLKALEP